MAFPPDSAKRPQSLGIPFNSTCSVGVTSLVEDGRTGLLLSSGDIPMLAARLRHVFEDNSLAALLGSQEREVAVRRHDPGVIVHYVVTAYKDVLKKST